MLRFRSYNSMPSSARVLSAAFDMAKRSVAVQPLRRFIAYDPLVKQKLSNFLKMATQLLMDTRAECETG